MEEKELIIGEPSKKAKLMLLLIGLGLVALALILYALNYGECREYWSIRTILGSPFPVKYTNSLLQVMLFDTYAPLVSILLDMGIIITFIGIYNAITFSKVSIAVSNKRVYGNAMGGKYVDLPLDIISSVAVGSLKCVSVISTSGKFNFKGIENNVEIQKTVGELLQKRGQLKQETQSSVADELKKYNELLEKGVISKEEFDKKKKKLLGL